jgi:hypothetical protein
MLLIMRWRIHGEEEAWSSPWLSVRRIDVEQPDGERVDYHAIRLSDVAAAVVFRTTSASYVGPPTERNESDRVEWIPLADVPAMITRHEILSGITLVGLQQALLTRDASAKAM